MRTADLPSTPLALIPLLWDQLAVTAGLEAWGFFPAADSSDALPRLARFEAELLRDGLRAYVAPRSVTVARNGSSRAFCRHGEPEQAPGDRGDDRSPLGWAVFMDRRR